MKRRIEKFIDMSTVWFYFLKKRYFKNELTAIAAKAIATKVFILFGFLGLVLLVV